MTEQELSGILIVQKHQGATSHDIVNQIRRLYGTRRVGHTGTLDPMAEGVLVVLIGRAAKAAEYLVCDQKKYEAVLRLGLTTDTEDITGTVLTECDAIPDEAAVRQVCAGFVGQIRQIPPMYSALKVNGKKLCDLARSGVSVEREARQITVHALTVTPTESVREYRLAVHCSSGTYIRTLCADIGQALGCGGVMAALIRTEAGGFSLAQAHTVAALTEMTEAEREACLLPTEQLFESLAVQKLPPFYERLCRNGCEIYLAKIGKPVLTEGERVRLYGADGFFGLGEVRAYPDGLAVKAIKFL